MTKYKLRCFQCTNVFESKEAVFRNHEGYPICRDCLWENLSETWDCEYLEYIIDEMVKKHNRNYNKWEKWFHENHVLCDGEEHDDYSFYYEHKDNIVTIDGKNYCQSCYEEMGDFIEIKTIEES